MEQAIREIVEALRDPDLNKSFGELGAVHDVQLEGEHVKVFLKLIQPLHCIAREVDEMVKTAIRNRYPKLTAETYVQELVPPQPTGNGGIPMVKNFIAVASGKGGVGKSTVAANLAVVLAQFGARVGLLDADIHGPSAPTLFGMEGEQLPARKLEGGRIIGYPLEKYGVQLASIGFVMDRNQAAILRGPLQAGYFMTLVEQIEWGELDYLIFDLPPGTGDIQLTLTQKLPLTGAVIVTTPQDIALADVRRGIAMFRKVNVPILGVIENMSFYQCPACGHKEEIFRHGGGQRIAEELAVPFLGSLPLNRVICEASDRGIPVVLEDTADIRRAFHNVACALLKQLRSVNAQRLGQPPLEIAL